MTPSRMRSAGPLPIGARTFRLAVGGLDFRGTLPGWTPLYSDALQVITDPIGIGGLLADMIDQGALDREPDGIGKAQLELSADYLHRRTSPDARPTVSSSPTPLRLRRGALLACTDRTHSSDTSEQPLPTAAYQAGATPRATAHRRYVAR